MSEYVPKSTYVPTFDEVETAFHEFASDLETRFPGEYESAPEFADWREAMHGFRRWITEYTRVKQAEAWDEGWESGYLYGYLGLLYASDNPYREVTEQNQTNVHTETF